jgi:hypothetical protein
MRQYPKGIAKSFAQRRRRLADCGRKLLGHASLWPAEWPQAGTDTKPKGEVAGRSVDADELDPLNGAQTFKQLPEG